MEGHKQKCRQAAQWRRLLENLEYDQLASCLPMHQEVSRSLLDKAGLVRMAISYLRLHRFINDGLPSWESASEAHNSCCFTGLKTDFHPSSCSSGFYGTGHKILEATDGFLFCLSESYQILYVSETVSLGFGLSQIDLIGTSILQYIYKDDVQMFLSLANQCCTNAGPGIAKAVLRIRSTLTRRSVKEKSKQTAGYKVVEVYISKRMKRTDGEKTQRILGFVGQAIPVILNSPHSLLIDSWSFVFSAYLNLKITYCDNRSQNLFSVSFSAASPAVSFYTLVHPDDCGKVEVFHREILRVGESSCDCFRLILSNLHYCCVHAVGIQVYKTRSNKYNDGSIVIVCHIIGLLEAHGSDAEL